MKRLLALLTLAVVACTTASAQNTPYRTVIGPYYDATGAVALADPTTTIVVDLTIEKEQTIVGPYARYAQKYLDVRGSLVEKTQYLPLNPLHPRALACSHTSRLQPSLRRCYPIA